MLRGLTHRHCLLHHYLLFPNRVAKRMDIWEAQNSQCFRCGKLLLQSSMYRSSTFNPAPPTLLSKHTWMNIWGTSKYCVASHPNTAANTPQVESPARLSSTFQKYRTQTSSPEHERHDAHLVASFVPDVYFSDARTAAPAQRLPESESV
jgi:hypothetical protein